MIEGLASALIGIVAFAYLLCAFSRWRRRRSLLCDYLKVGGTTDED